MKYSWLALLCCLSGCGTDQLGVLYVGIDLAGAHDLELPVELDGLDAEAIGASTGRVDALPVDGMITVDAVGLPQLPVDFHYLPVFAFADDARVALEPAAGEAHEHGDLSWELTGPALEDAEDGGMTSMLMLGDDAGPDLGALRSAAVLIVGVPELEPAPEPVMVLQGEFVFNEERGTEGGGAMPAGHNHGP